jgi:PAS domain S-box-containing protein
MTEQLRSSGIDIVGNIPWGTHFCQFYQNKADLLDTLVPYFKAGLENNEFGMWVTSEALSAQEAEQAMTEAMPDFGQYLARGQMEIIPYTDWYLKDGVFDLQRVLGGWVNKLTQALARNYNGMRVTGNTAWLEKADWESFTQYEAAINTVIGKRKMIALCTYCLDKCSATEIIDVVRNHEFALIKQGGRWDIVESAMYKATKEALARARDELESKVAERTAELEETNIKLKQGMAEYKRVAEALRVSQQRYHSLFDNMPVALCEMDLSRVKPYLDNLREQGVKDFRDYFQSNPQAVQHCMELTKIVVVNQASRELFQARNKDELLTGMGRTFLKQTYDVFWEALVALTKGHTQFTAETTAQTLKGNKKHISLTALIAPGYEDTWSRVLISIADLTERKQAEEELKSSRAYLHKLNDSLQEVIFTIKMPERLINYVNRSVKNVFGYEAEECTGRTTEFLYPTKKEYRSFGDKLKKTIEEERESLHTEHLLRRKNGEVFPAEVTTTLFREGGKITQVVSILRDITERKRGEKALRLSEARLREAQRIAHLGNWDWDIVANRLVWSDEIYRIFGLSPQQFGATYDSFLSYVHPEDRELVKQSVNEVLYEGRPYNIDHRIVQPDGSERIVHESAEVTLNEEGVPIRMLGTVQDITELKIAESRLRALSERLVQTQEEERRKIGRELHDVVGQSMTVLKLMLYHARDSSQAEIGAALKEVDALVDEVAEKVRSLSHTLQPAMLEDFGLLEALLNQFEWLTSKTGLKVNFKHEGLPRRFPTNVETAVFRVIQEALSNVIRHARVKEVEVTIKATDDRLYLEVEDKGIGFEPATIPADSIGFRGMQERAELIGGSLVIDSSPGVGTCVNAEFPLS